MKIRTALIAALVPTLAAAGVVAGTVTASPARASAPIKVAVAGDSLTAFSDSWWNQLNDPGIAKDGGLAVSGATSWYIYSNIQPVPSADVLVVMIGTNDVRHGIPITNLEQHIEGIVNKVGAPHVLLSYLPPSDDTNEMISGTSIDCRVENVEYTRGLVDLAERHGWLVADPFAPWRTYTGAYASGATTDGVHPTSTVFGEMDSGMSLYIRQAAQAATGAGS